METTIFYLLASIILIFSVLAVTTRRILRAAVYLLVALGTTAGIYFMIEYFFLAAVQLLVYVGGVVVLIIFSILLTSHIDERLEKVGTIKLLGAGALTIVGILLTVNAFMHYDFVLSTLTIDSPTVANIGESLLNYGEGGYVLPFEVISILLLAAMIGAIIIAKRVKDND